MANRETPFQSELVQAMKKKGYHAFKASHQYSTGVLDLWCRAPMLGVWIECKFMKVAKNFRTEKVFMTVPQFSFARKEITSGGTVVKIIGYARENVGRDTHGLLICNARHQHTQVMREWMNDTLHPAHVVKVPGTPWPVETILNRIIQMEGGTIPYADAGREE